MTRAKHNEQRDHIDRLLVIAQENPDFYQRTTWLLALQEAGEDLLEDQRRQARERAWRRTFIRAVQALVPAGLTGTAFARHAWKEHAKGVTLTSAVTVAAVVTVAAMPPDSGPRRREPINPGPRPPVVTAPPTAEPTGPAGAVQRPETIAEAPTASPRIRPTQSEPPTAAPAEPAETAASTGTEQVPDPEPTGPGASEGPALPTGGPPHAPEPPGKDGATEGGTETPEVHDDDGDAPVCLDLTVPVADLPLCLPRVA